MKEKIYAEVLRTIRAGIVEKNSTRIANRYFGNQTRTGFSPELDSAIIVESSTVSVRRYVVKYFDDYEKLNKKWRRRESKPGPM